MQRKCLLSKNITDGSIFFLISLSIFPAFSTFHFLHCTKLMQKEMEKKMRNYICFFIVCLSFIFSTSISSYFFRNCDGDRRIVSKENKQNNEKYNEKRNEKKHNFSNHIFSIMIF